MLKIGITGGIGSGKSMVCRIFSILGVPIFEADKVARELMNDNQELIDKIANTFGSDYIFQAKPDRHKIASLVFNNREALTKLNNLIHPMVALSFAQWLDANSNKPYIIKEAAILIETGLYKELDKTVLVYTPDELRIQRVMDRDRISSEMVIERMNNQMPEDEKGKYANEFIYNDGQQMLLPQVLALDSKWREG